MLFLSSEGSPTFAPKRPRTFRSGILKKKKRYDDDRTISMTNFVPALFLLQILRKISFFEENFTSSLLFTKIFFFYDRRENDIWESFPKKKIKIFYEKVLINCKKKP